jgi:hypothetical protein
VSSQSLLFRPLPRLIVSLAGALIYALWVTWRFAGGDLSGHYLYVVPIVAPFVAFVLDRVEEIREGTIISWTIDALVVGTAMLRMIGAVPFVSGHALFLVYALLRRGSLVTRITAGLVMLEVVYLKFFVWHDFITPLTGTALATVAALITRRGERVRLQNDGQMVRGRGLIS